MPQQQVLARCKETLAKATMLYGVDLSKVTIRLDLKGRAAGQAYVRGNQYGMRFNRDMLTREAFDHMLNNTVPHEVAHLVCFMKPTLGRNHDYGWSRVCRELGGTGETRHKEAVVYGKGATYEYTTTTGHAIRVSQQIHGRVQQGVGYSYKGGKGKITKACAYSIVGVQGRTLDKPIVKVAQPTLTPLVQLPIPATLSVEQKAAMESFNARVVPKPMPFAAGASKASIARSIMLAGSSRGQTYEAIIEAIMLATGHPRQLARATYAANASKVGIKL